MTKPSINLNTDQNPIDVEAESESDPMREPLWGGSEVLIGDELSEQSFWDAVSPREVSFFKIALLDKLRQRSYHRATLDGSICAAKLMADYRAQLFRSEVVCRAKGKPKIERLLFCLGGGVFIYYDGTSLSIYAPTPEAAAQVAKDFGRYLKPAPVKRAGFLLVSTDIDGPRTEVVELRSGPASSVNDLSLHYGQDFAAWEEGWLEHLTKRKSGITILYGPPGCGKTTYLRMLMSRLMDRFVFYFLPLSSFNVLAEPAFVGFWIAQNRRHSSKTKLVIVEDAEDLLLPRDERSRAGVSNLLNIGDGFLGDYLKLHVLATTNTPMHNLDAAVKRPGRLMGMREFRRLSRVEALQLAKAKGLELPDQPDYSLAEIYDGTAEALDLGRRELGFSSRQ